jgi:RNA polymerase sigma-70 factor (ECF subfamily)
MTLPTTHWADIAAADQPDSALRRDALDSVLSRYWLPLRAHIERKFGVDTPHAEDLLQSFCLEKILQKKLLGLADPERGRFRTFLLNALDHHALNQLRSDGALKRRPSEPLVSLDELGEVYHPACGSQPDSQFDLDWARQVIQVTLDRMRGACDASGSKRIWGVFEGRLLRDLSGQSRPLSYEELVEAYGFASSDQAMNALNTAKRMFNRILRSAVADYLDAPHQKTIEEEIAQLKAVLLRNGELRY